MPGTPAYLAPEVALGSLDVDGRADLYAAGCVAYWLLTRPPRVRRRKRRTDGGPARAGHARSSLAPHGPAGPAGHSKRWSCAAWRRTRPGAPAAPTSWRASWPTCGARARAGRRTTRGRGGGRTSPPLEGSRPRARGAAGGPHRGRRRGAARRARWSASRRSPRPWRRAGDSTSSPPPTARGCSRRSCCAWRGARRRPIRCARRCFIGHREWFQAYLGRTGLTADKAPLFVRLPDQHGQDMVVDYRREKVIEGAPSPVAAAGPERLHLVAPRRGGPPARIRTKTRSRRRASR